MAFINHQRLDLELTSTHWSKVRFRAYQYTLMKG